MVIVILTPLLMLADYFLTLLGNKYSKRVPYFRSETYELNPEFRNSIDNNQKISYRHLFYTVFFTGIGYAIYRSGDKEYLDAFAGYIVTTFGVVNARHIGNILLYRYSIKNPGEAKGVLYTSHIYNLKNSLFQTIGLATLFLLFLILHPMPFLVGAFVAQIMGIIHHLNWINKHNNPANGLNDPWVKDQRQVSVVEETGVK